MLEGAGVFWFQGVAAQRQRADWNADDERHRPSKHLHLLRAIPQAGRCKMFSAPSEVVTPQNARTFCLCCTVDLWLVKQDRAWQSPHSQNHPRRFFAREATSVRPKGEVELTNKSLNCFGTPIFDPRALSFPSATDPTGKQCGSTVESTPGSGSPRLSAYGLYTMWVLWKLVSVWCHGAAKRLKLLTFLSQSLSFYNYNKEITDILNNMDVYVLPVMNPDGYKYTWTTVRTHILEYFCDFFLNIFISLCLCFWG